MSLTQPGEELAGSAMTDRALIDAMIQVEAAWSGVRGAQTQSLSDWQKLVSEADLRSIEIGALDGGGNPVIGLVGVLRDRLRKNGQDEIADSLHRGLTSQDVFDTGFNLALRSAHQQVRRGATELLTTLNHLANEHRNTIRMGRTLTQPAVPTTFGLVVATWTEGVLDALHDLDRSTEALSLQFGGATGTLAGPATQTGASGFADTSGLGAAFAERPDLPMSRPWHTNRAQWTRQADAWTGLHDALSRIANDVLLANRPEIGELSEGAGGGSSTMPHKQNPVRSTLIRSRCLGAPMLAAQVHVAAAAGVDQRPDGGWHAQWAPLANLVRSGLVVLELARQLLGALAVHPDRMLSNAEAHHTDLLAEARRLMSATESSDSLELADYLGDAQALTGAAICRSQDYLRHTSGRESEN